MKKALLVVDAQVDVLGASIDRDRMLANLTTLVANARSQGIPVLWVRHNADEELLLGSDGWQIVPELAPAAGEPIIDKRYGDAFADTDLADRLAEVGADAVVLCGAQTDACIISTLHGALYRGLPVTLVSDAHTTEDLRQWGAQYAPEQAIGLVNMVAGNARLPGVRSTVVTTKEVFAGE